jgi:Kdo2-lipid IVA lauroyltransferase/acyltransferase
MCGVAVLRFGSVLLSLLPFSFRSVTGGLLGVLVSFIPTRERKIAALQLRRFLGGKGSSHVAHVYWNLGRTALESVRLLPWLSRNMTRVTCDKLDAISSWIKEGRGIVCLTAHTGNWDLLAAYMVQIGVPLTVIGKEMKNKPMQEVLGEIRANYGVRTLWRSDTSAVKEIVKTLKQGEVVAGLIDQDTTVASLLSPFFGEPAKTPSALIALGKKVNAKFVTAFLFRIGFFRYQVFVEELDGDLSAEELLKEYHRRLEGLIRRFPSQWVWIHKRWRTLPSGETQGTKAYVERLMRELKTAGR